MSTSSQTHINEVPDLGLYTESHPVLRYALVTGDGVAIALTWLIALLTPGATLANAVTNADFRSVLMTVGGLMIVVFAMLCVMAIERLYLARVCSMRSVEISRIARVSAVGGISALVVSKFIGEPHLARIPMLVGTLTFVFLNAWRVSYSTWLANARRHGRFVRSVLLVGASHEAHSLYMHIAKHPELGYRFYGFVGTPKDAAENDFDIAWLGSLDRLPDVIDATGISGAFVVGGALGTQKLNSVLRELLDRQVHVHLSTGVNGIDHRRMRSHSVAYEPLVYVERADLEGWQLAIKRILDVSIALTILALTSPLIIATAAAIRLQSPGPIFFRQKRVGRFGEHFTMIKFRSMVVDAEQRLEALQIDNLRSGPLFKLAADPRVTRLGKVLRATSIDELPQLFNVLRGHMSLVGPRPALPEEVAQFEAKLKTRQNVMPGITGLWQVEGRDNPDFNLYQRLDIFYVENWSVALDFAILTGTAKVVVIRAVQSFGRFRSRRSGSGTEATVNTLVLN